MIDHSKIIAAQNRYRERHPDRVKESRKKWLEANPDYYIKYRHAHKDAINANRRKRRLLKNEK